MKLSETKFNANISLTSIWFLLCIWNSNWVVEWWQVIQPTLNDILRIPTFTVEVGFYELSLFMNLFCIPYECLFMWITSAFMKFRFLWSSLFVPWGLITNNFYCNFILTFHTVVVYMNIFLSSRTRITKHWICRVDNARLLSFTNISHYFLRFFCLAINNVAITTSENDIFNFLSFSINILVNLKT